MKKPAIPLVSSGDAKVNQFAATVKQTLDTMTGQHKSLPPLPRLATTATLADLIAAYNLLLERVQGTLD